MVTRITSLAPQITFGAPRATPPTPLRTHRRRPAPHFLMSAFGVIAGRCSDFRENPNIRQNEEA